MNTRTNPAALKPTARPAAPAKPTARSAAPDKTLVGLVALQKHIDLMLEVSEEFEALVKGIDLSQLPTGFRNRMLMQVELAGASQAASTVVFNRVLEQLTEFVKPNSVMPRARPLRRPVAASPIGLDLDLTDIPG